jgi:hypothetical protein
MSVVHERQDTFDETLYYTIYSFLVAFHDTFSIIRLYSIGDRVTSE